MPLFNKRRLLVIFLLSSCTANAQKNETLWYSQPASMWTEALPLGNGRLGAMVFGRINQEVIQLNEGTLWSGGPVAKVINPQAASYLPQIRKALMEEEDFAKAEPLVKKMQGLFTESYMPLGDLIINQDFADTAVSNYYRELDIRRAVTTTRFTVDGVNYSREVFVSAPDQVIVVRITADKLHRLNLHIATKSLLRYQLVAKTNEIIMKGNAPAHVDPSYINKNKNPVIWEDSSGCKGMRYELIVKAINRGGTINCDTTGIRINNANEVTLYLSAATSFNGFDKCPDKNGKDEHKVARNFLDRAIAKQYTTLLKNHCADFAKYYDRVTFEIRDSTGAAAPDQPSDRRLLHYTEGAYDPGIETLYFNYGRYLLISCSRPGGTAANLQGIWNAELRPPWSSNYTININTEMNYWPAEITNLSEMHLPLFDLIKNISQTGKNTAKEFYNAKG